MIHKIIKLKDIYPVCDEVSTLECYIPSNFKEFDIGRRHKPLLIIPGGGYEFVSDREGEPVALKFLAHQIACFVLNYPIWPFKNPHPIIDGVAAMDYIINHKDEFMLTDDISVMGFSAGGHFAGTLAAHSNKKIYKDLLNSKNEIKVDKAILCYAVISSDLNIGHEGSIMHITNNFQENMDYYSIDKQVTKDFPKTYIWTTAEDDCVNPKNSDLLAEALKKNGVFYKYHLFPHGWHGLSVCDWTCNADGWVTPENMKDIPQWVDETVDFILHN